MTLYNVIYNFITYWFTPDFVLAQSDIFNFISLCFTVAFPILIISALYRFIFRGRKK